MDVKLYSTHCPRCIVLEKKLNQKEIKYELIDDFDVNILIDKGFLSAPILVVGDEYMEFSKANEWIQNN